MKKLFIVALLFQGTIFTADQELPELPIDRIFPLTSYRPEGLYGPAYWQRQINMRAGLEVIEREETEERGLQYEANFKARNAVKKERELTLITQI